MTEHCRKCGEPLRDDAVFCANCGEKVPGKQMNFSKKHILIIVIVIAVVAIIASSFLIIIVFYENNVIND